jgi:LCP family protein required for cell wall assembly
MTAPQLDRSDPGRRDPERRHTWPQRLLIVFNAGLVVASLTAAAVFGYFYVQFGKLPHVAIADGILSGTGSSSDPQNFLLVGSDTRQFADGATDPKFGGDQGPARADTIMLVRVDARAHHAWVISFPRDLLVEVAPDGHLQRINTAYSGEDGAQNLIQTIKDNFDVPIHHFAEVNFEGLRQVVDAIGGVPVNLASPVRDYDLVERRNQSGLLILDTGCVTLHGDQALAYVRSRHFQYQQPDKTWKSVEGDLDRNIRQQDFVRRTLRTALSKGLASPTRINKLTKAATGNLRISKSLDLAELVKLGRNFRSLAPDTMSQYALPVSGDMVRLGGQLASVLRIFEKDKAAAEQILDVFRGTPEKPAEAPDLSPSSVNVRVLNGSGVPGQAGEASDALGAVGFPTHTPGDATKTASTVIRYGPGQEAKAGLLARYLEVDAALVSSPGLKGVDVELVTGTNFEGVRDEPRESAPSATTTTVAPLPPPKTPDC